MQSAQTTLKLPEGKVTQPAKKFRLATNRRGEVIQLFKTNPAGNRAQRQKFNRMMRLALRRGKRQDKIVQGYLDQFPDLVEAKDAEVLTTLIALDLGTGPKGSAQIDRIVRRKLGLPDPALETPEDNDAVAA